MKNIILLRGLVRESRHWGDFPQKLQNSINDSIVLTPEIQGVGKYTSTNSPDNLEEMIEFMRSQIKDQIENQNNIIIAMSLGGMIAKCWSEKYPQDFNRMILINTSFKGINQIYHRLTPHAIKVFLSIFITPHVAMRERKILQLVSNNKVAQDKVHRNWVEIQQDAPVSRTSFINQIKAAMKFEPKKSKPKLPLLLIGAKKDRLCDVKCTQRLFQLWGGKMKLHQSAGHDIPLDDPEWLITKIKDFIL